MKIEVGKFYQARDGSKIRIYAVDGGGPYCIHGAIHNSMEKFIAFTWDKDGGGSASTASYDIVSEWVEPRKKKIAWVSVDGDVHMSASDQELSYKWVRMPHLDEPCS